MSGRTFICCSCDEHYGGNALACAKAIAVGTTTPCGCDCHRAEPAESQEDQLEDAWHRAQSWKNIAERAMAVSESIKNDMLAVCEERNRLRAALEMLAQVRHVCGSAQGTFRRHLALVDAVLAGADVRDLETVEAVAAGTWRAKG
jgi:hypothetical protein